MSERSYSGGFEEAGEKPDFYEFVFPGANISKSFRYIDVFLKPDTITIGEAVERARAFDPRVEILNDKLDILGGHFALARDSQGSLFFIRDQK